MAGLALALALHAAAVWGLLQFEGVRRSIIDAAPIMVNFIVPLKIEEPPKPPPEPRPKPMSKPKSIVRPVPPPPEFTTRAPESPAPYMREPPKIVEPAPVEVTPAPAAEAPSAPPAPVIPPRFNAAYLRNPPPAYPALSRRYREQGRVLLRVFVSAAGAAEKIELQASSGWPRLDEAAQQAVRSWRFVPARQGDTPVPAWVNVPINFTVEG